ncbi:DUF6443 domain-containing protein [uncultured Aquimarina sp.]|uniref:DUF6443 domain-containing protein n=1 Tax=uncultured Aquimarina sp. TaxID=575652 RepID=UPI0026017C09|nr:DUF6443 domain-containing protein [uncultured Aquimarina sp.]
MKNLFLVITVLVSTIVSSQTQSENYIKTTAYQKEVKEGEQDQVLESDKIVSVNYADGLGRAKQSIAVRAGGQGQSTNILNWTGDWTLGGGHTPLFNMNGQSSDNERIFGANPFGEQSLLWKCGNDTNRDADGGWNTDYIPVDKNVSYRYTVWVKRTGSQDGTTYHGTQNVNNLSGSANNNPYFWSGDMPNLNQWYLLVGVVHPHTYTGGNSGISGVYDSNGTKVRNGNDFKWRNNTTSARFRNYLYYAVDTNVKQYFWNPVLTQIDGTGAPINQLIIQSKPKDIITHYQYDELGRQPREYLPYASDQTQNGSIYTDPLTELNNFYNTAKYQNTTNPYSETIVEKSPLSRPLKQAAPGLDWIAKATGDDHTIKLDRRANTTTDGIVYFKVNFTNGNTEVPSLVKVSNYAKNELLVNITKDENWKSSDGDNHTTREYTDKSGRVILKRTYNAGVANDTYYVYDDFGNLTYVIPPKITVSNGVSTTELNELGYQYKYDHRNRLVEKKIPGKGWEYIVYNKLDQPVLTQDANQRAKSPKEWLFTKYDALGRVAYTGIIKNDQNRLTIQDSADNNTSYTQYETKQSSSSTIAGTPIYYTNNTIPGFIDKILTINYYDNYTFDRDGMNKPASVYGVSTSNNVKSLPTGSKVRVLGTNNWITTVTGYDTKGQAIWTGSRNDYLDTTDKVEMQLDFTGKPEIIKTTHTKGSNAAIVTIDIFTYDHMGRLVTQKQQINDFAEELIAHNVYDDLGQLESKKVGNAEQAPLQTVDYAYNVRGWLTDINDVDNIGDDLFTFKIHYDQVEGYYNVPKLYNGNISQTIWKTANDNVKRSYSYQYDDLNRITRANSLKGSTLMSGDAYSMWGIAYDKNGNIGRITRNGRPGGGSIKTIDELYYTYSNNQLLKVREAITSSYKNEGFKDGTNTNNDYIYDQNGNLTVDRNKGISSISYNHLNLPNTVAISNSEGTGNITYIYDATGAKQKKVVSGGSSLIVEYAGNHVYENGQLKFFNHPEGYIEPSGTDKYDYVYQYKDHLGNIRLSYSDKDKDGHIDILRNNTDVDGDGDNAREILQEKNYYPFGLQHKGYNDLIVSEHKYGFNGVEEENEIGLNLLSMDLRKYDSAIARWTGIDPVTHHSMSTYNAFDNNPVFWADPSGADAWTYVGNGQYKNNRTSETSDDWQRAVSETEGGGSSGPQDHIKINTQTKKAEIFADDNDYDTIETDGVVSYSPKGNTESRLRSEGYSIRHTEGVGMGAFDNAVLILSGDAVFAWIGRGISGLGWFAKASSKLDDVSGIVLQASERAAIIGGNASKWPWKRTTASIAELTAGGGNCLACARKIQEAIGGRVINIVDQYGAKYIGAMYNKAGKLISRDFQIHHAVRKGDMIFDRVTGPNGLHINDYKKLFEYGKYLNFN